MCKDRVHFFLTLGECAIKKVYIFTQWNHLEHKYRSC
nr:MAG TPA: hypothetical protein [Bacteriophage sp.]